MEILVEILKVILSFNPKKIYVYDKYIQISKTSKFPPDTVKSLNYF